MKEADVIADKNSSRCAYTKGHIKEQGQSIDSLQSEVDTQERKVEKLENTLEAALKRIEHLE
jgi:predicted RNase H-like nuclease (RuvC/YqgF family)